MSLLNTDNIICNYLQKAAMNNSTMDNCTYNFPLGHIVSLVFRHNIKELPSLTIAHNKKKSQFCFHRQEICDTLDVVLEVIIKFPYFLLLAYFLRKFMAISFHSLGLTQRNSCTALKKNSQKNILSLGFK